MLPTNTHSKMSLGSLMPVLVELGTNQEPTDPAARLGPYGTTATEGRDREHHWGCGMTPVSRVTLMIPSRLILR